MITFFVYCNDKMSKDMVEGKVDFGMGIIKKSGKNIRIVIPTGEIDTLNTVISVIKYYGVSSQEETDEDLEDAERDLLESEY
ncbi:MAG: hypothetical protein NTW30_04945 [Candidatus Aenigmarchaeota archaeon]|nr:hypothetical protein [Candidatus Aenigmarchaeota archaeon]